MSDRDKLTKSVVSNKVSGYVVDPYTGNEYDATFKDLTEAERQELNELEEKGLDGDEDAAGKLTSKIVDDYLLHDDFKSEELGIAWKQSIMVGFLRALGDNKALQEAEEFFESVEDSGNE